MTKKPYDKTLFVLVAPLILVALIVMFFRSTAPSIVDTLQKPSEESFLAPGRDWPSEKKVEDYFVEHLRMTPQEALENRSKPGVDAKVMLRLREHSTLEGLLSNLEYYGFVKNKEALQYALEHSTDTVPGHANPLTVGENTVDIYAYYRISENMTAWEIADQLLNHPTYFAYDEYNYMFMP